MASENIRIARGCFFHKKTGRILSSHGKFELTRSKGKRGTIDAKKKAKKDGFGDSELGIQDLAEESTSLASSQNMVGELLMSGQAQLNSLIDQRRRMRGAKRMVLNIGNTIGLSNSTMRMIERRDENDVKLVLAGMVLTLLV
eukprot:CAMPEP_0194094102 /NCGR_PEP_ID=MMETSP0149-20130528/52714_1 /TAXON_ID=122233 /ORGANISM="Chaetoceros debilis, Strain MM31A-1" /LENGTH=141 /DNA_ID=CAMNT_0038779635 /DNA_START=99 /DNA_END=521 /DNA_ORIENTATION=-